MFNYLTLVVFTLEILSSFAVKPWEPEERNGTLHYHQQFLHETKTHAKDIEIVFYGDSITMGWNGNGHDVWQKHYAPLHAVNYGIGGDRTQHLIWRMENGEIDGLHPKVVVLMIGTNNLGHGDSDDDIAKGVMTILEIIHKKLPHSKVLLLAISPRGTAGHTFTKHLKSINIIISKFANGNTIQFLNMEKEFIDAEGNVKASLYVHDKLHMSKEGYEVWAHTMDPLLHKMLGIL